MITLILVILIVLWLFGYSPYSFLPLPNPSLFNFNGKDISLYDLLVFMLILWLINLLPRPFRDIATVVLVLFVVSALGLIAIPGLSNIIIIALIVGLIAYLLKGH